MTLENGYLLNGRYRIADILGQGGMGAVYRAIDENLGMEVAVKENFYTTDEYSRQFKREATILANLKHTNLPRVSDHFEIGDQGQYLVMDYIEGEDLRQRMDRLGILPGEEVIITGAAICDALEYLHTRKQPILHRDIKPGNLKIDPEGVVYLVDFGLAKIVKGSQVTTTGARAMTPGYSSPEQYGTARTDERSDIYSLGATLYAALSNTIPEDGLARAMEQADLTPLRKRNSKVPRRLAAVIEKALAVHPEDRYQSAKELKNDLLQASTATRAIKHSEEMTVKPPPEEVIAEIAQGRGNKAKGAVDSGISGESKSRKRRRRKAKARRRLWTVVFLVIVLAGGWVAMGMPGKENLSDLIPIASKPTATQTPSPEVKDTPTVEPTEEPPTPTHTDIPPTETNPPTPTSVPITPTETPTEEPTPTISTTPLTPTMVVNPDGSATPTETLVYSEYPQDDEILAFVSLRSGSAQIWTYSFSDGSLEQITNFEGGACQPAWSPDGQNLIFISPCRKNQLLYLDSFIYLLNLETSEITKLEVQVGSFDPVWSPNGDSILFTTAMTSVQSQIYKYTMADNSIEWMTGDLKANIDPEFSPDGTQIVFATTRGGGYYLYTMPNEPGADAQVLTRSGDFNNYKPTWSVLGKIVVSSAKIGDFETMWGVNEDMIGAPPEEYLTYRINADSLYVPELDPDFSSNGLWLAYQGWPLGDNHDIFIMREDGLIVIRLTTDPAKDFDPAWKP